MVAQGVSALAVFLALGTIPAIVAVAIAYFAFHKKAFPEAFGITLATCAVLALTFTGHIFFAIAMAIAALFF